MTLETESKLINDRADELESIGFKYNCNEKHGWYEKGDIKIPATLILCASTRDWNKLIEENKTPTP